ncbi:MAG: dihydroorotate dehydrogenase electron transfer subunit [Chloracidobacterium sp.]|uniref:Dihydroorotate dehydrogenase electron transfer subunit n=1 Tax=Chloracidobacterium validum TaxID=2821543 RepID=A0ABX8B8P0_9BACT|nr:dihydroorotate dehydrogenase electron transfer subunit [Chloracidobacterium validum]QUW03031.1 dihydroorotate dehydrogenase electron transfer subunit [Chloracidobacterium validum]
MKDLTLTVTENRTFGSYGHLTLVTEEKIAFTPGQFAMLKPAGALEPLWRRAMAIYRVRATTQAAVSGSQLEFMYQVFGRGTQSLQRLHAGDAVRALLPLGKAFDTAPVAVGGREALLVAGGVGSAALLALAERLKREQVPTRLFLGGRSRVDLIGLEDFTALGVPVHVATNDGSQGVTGFVTVPFERFLREHQADVRAGKFVVYACGPHPMLARVAALTAGACLLTYVSVEERMACGFGVCVGCVVAVQSQAGDGDYRRACVEGPVFRADELNWTA